MSTTNKMEFKRASKLCKRKMLKLVLLTTISSPRKFQTSVLSFLRSLPLHTPQLKRKIWILAIEQREKLKIRCLQIIITSLRTFWEVKEAQIEEKVLKSKKKPVKPSWIHYRFMFVTRVNSRKFCPKLRNWPQKSVTKQSKS